MSYPASMQLGAALSALSDAFRSPHVMVEIRDAYAFGFANRLWSKRHAAQLAIASNLSLNTAHGHGNRAARRANLLPLL